MEQLLLERQGGSGMTQLLRPLPSRLLELWFCRKESPCHVVICSFAEIEERRPVGEPHTPPSALMPSLVTASVTEIFQLCCSGAFELGDCEGLGGVSLSNADTLLYGDCRH